MMSHTTHILPIHTLYTHTCERRGIGTIERNRDTEWDVKLYA